MRANRTISEGALRAIRDRHGIAFERGEIDVKEFLERYKSEEVQRAWFNNLNIQNVQSASISGRNVDKSEDFGRYLDRGDLSAVQIVVLWDGLKYSVVVSQANAIFFYMRDEVRAIQLAGYVNSILRELPAVASSQAVSDASPEAELTEPGPELELGYDQLKSIEEIDDPTWEPSSDDS
jgi:hypothetical protein